MRNDTNDFSRIAARHDAINLRLEQWAQWVSVRPQAWKMLPMWKFYKAPKQWDSDLYIPIEINSLEAHEIERAVAMLPEKNRTAIRWFYVFKFIHAGKMRRELAVTDEGLANLVHDGRSMLIDRLKQRLKYPA